MTFTREILSEAGAIRAAAASKAGRLLWQPQSSTTKLRDRSGEAAGDGIGQPLRMPIEAAGDEGVAGARRIDEAFGRDRRTCASPAAVNQRGSRHRRR